MYDYLIRSVIVYLFDQHIRCSIWYR